VSSDKLYGANIVECGATKQYSQQDSIVKLPIIMYHSISNNAPNKYNVTPVQLRRDFEYILQQGWNPIFLSQVVDYVERDVALPNKPIAITFDDGYSNNYINILPLIQQYNVKVILSIVGEFTDQHQDLTIKQPANSHMNHIQLKTMLDSNLVELASHTYAMHNIRGINGRKGIRRLKGEDDSQYKRVLQQDDAKLVESWARLGVRPCVFTFPFGVYNDVAKDCLRECGYKIALTCTHNINIINQDTDLMQLNRFNRPSGPSSKEYFCAIQELYDIGKDKNIRHVLKHYWWR
jgi:peptidoglycan/xylan/chitin deacetylase (PgdA/CDA1 family)